MYNYIIKKGEYTALGWFSKNKELKFKRRRKFKYGLVLSGGAGRGIGHIGVIKAFESLGVEFDIIVGTSAGSVVGALYAYGKTSVDMEAELSKLKISDIRGSKKFFLPSSTKTLEETVNRILGGEKVFSELKKPFVAVATNIKTGKEVRLGSGSVAKAVSASCAVPGYFKPVVWEDKVLVDGGLVNTVPVDVCRELGADYVIAVDVNETRGGGTDKIKLTNILSSTIGIMLKKNAVSYLHLADYCIFPKLKDFKSTKLENADAMIIEGEKAVLENKDVILKILNKKPKIKGMVCKRLDVEYV